MREATIHAKLFKSVTNVAALSLFATSDFVNWSAVLAMIPVQILGAQAGTHVILGRGIVIVRPLVMMIFILIAIKLASNALFP